MTTIEKQISRIYDLQQKLHRLHRTLRHAPSDHPVTKLFEKQALVMTEELLVLTGIYN